MDKKTRLAVLVAGDYRTWPRASEYIFDYTQKICDEADYFFVTWNTTRDYWYPEDQSIKTQRTVESLDIYSQFVKFQKNLVDFKLIEKFPQGIYGTNFYQSYLAHIANLLKRKHELNKGFVYDQVIEIRPDLLIYDSETPQQILTLQDFDVLMDIIYENPVPGTKMFPEAVDLYYQANSLTADVLCNRFFYQKTPHIDFQRYRHWPLGLHHHVFLADFVLARRIRPIKNPDSFCQIPIRLTFPKGDLRVVSFNTLWEYQTNFLNQTRKLA